VALLFFKTTEDVSMTFSFLVWTFERRRIHTDGVALPYLLLSNISKIKVYAHIWLCSFLLLKPRLRLPYDSVALSFLENLNARRSMD
jgi:hypothetical protein